MYKVRKINFGWYRRKHGILLENLPPGKQQLLIENSFMKWLESDPQTFEIIFKMEDMHDHEKNPNKIIWNPYKDTFTSLKQLEYDSESIEWKCAICRIDILSRPELSEVENFVCSKCQESHNSTNSTVDQRIVKSSVDFTEHCKKILKNEQTEFLKHIKKEAKKNQKKSHDQN
jgi:hypothetical protein